MATDFLAQIFFYFPQTSQKAQKEKALICVICDVCGKLFFSGYPSPFIEEEQQWKYP